MQFNNSPMTQVLKIVKIRRVFNFLLSALALCRTSESVTYLLLQINLCAICLAGNWCLASSYHRRRKNSVLCCLDYFFFKYRLKKKKNKSVKFRNKWVVATRKRVKWSGTGLQTASRLRPTSGLPCAFPWRNEIRIFIPAAGISSTEEF